MQKGQILIWIIVGFLVITIAGGAYYLGRPSTPKPSATPAVISQTPQPTSSSASDEIANWKTYNGEGFIFKYPQNWLVSREGIVGKVYDSATLYKKSLPFFTFYIDQLNQSLSDYINSIQQDSGKHPLASNSVPFQQRTISVNRQQAIVYYNPNYSSINEGKAGWYIVISNANGNRAIEFGPSSSDPTLDEIIGKIISTFKFL